MSTLVADPPVDGVAFMRTLDELEVEANAARWRFLDVVAGLTPLQAAFKPDKRMWSAIENTEHIVRAEHIGLMGMWRAIECVEAGRPSWEGDAPHRSKRIEDIIMETWREKEDAPPVAIPAGEGPLPFWASMLAANQYVLAVLCNRLRVHDLDGVYYPHPVSGPLSLRQRLEFLRFHLDRHRKQVAVLMEHPRFPTVEEPR